MTPLPKAPGKTWWEHQRTGLSKLVAALAFIVVALTQSHWELEHENVATFLFSTGLGLAAIGATGRIWCSFFISGRKDGELVTEGPYSISRNPLYVFSCIGLVGVGLSTETLTYPLLFLVIFGLYYPGIMAREERRLEELFGESFRQYRQRVPRFWPNRGLYSEPASWSSNPRLFRRHILSDIWFVWIAAIIELVEGLRNVGLLPHLLTLW
ncbi:MULTISPECIES: isoprenylcysteine carboxylmethyltransferase family protein [unclassified Cyanobium]|uniref:methyltransferase family protein n=1 Tax=unclassified Cyanobium TaxID=2627006 RepID=UPI0020CCF213|nr:MULTISPECIES: isoprenylcysteine carboxylmethyltransferase family protein [unclassified Cyanobium]MCP9778072.1 isoprenylcysteine carboxylmethyltransferase family protein [Cyanobium sp. Tous-M-B4]MCP9875030.1 isoprenylcysteine carboxylmethyltransferase family protein [Cyanobium sp. A2C-AMD]